MQRLVSGFFNLVKPFPYCKNFSMFFESMMVTLGGPKESVLTFAVTKDALQPYASDLPNHAVTRKLLIGPSSP